MTETATQGQVRQLIAQLESVRKRPGLYIFKASGILNFIGGFNAAAAALGLMDVEGKDRLGIWRQITVERGWELTAAAVPTQMAMQGFDPDAIVEETLLVEIAVWKQLHDLD
jgi:hypothetical protein